MHTGSELQNSEEIDVAAAGRAANRRSHLVRNGGTAGLVWHTAWQLLHWYLLICGRHGFEDGVEEMGSAYVVLFRHYGKAARTRIWARAS